MWTGFGAILPYLPIFLQEQAHSSLFMIGLIASMLYLGTLLFASPMGWLSDQIGRKPVLVSGIALYAVATFLFTRTTDPMWFVLFRLLEGVGTAAVMPAGQAFIADISSEADRSKAFGLLTTAQFGGLIAGPALAPPLYHLGGGGQSGFYLIFYFGAVLSAVAAVAAFALLKEPPRRPRPAEERGEKRRLLPPRAVLLSPAVLAFLLVAFTSHIAMGAFEVIWSLYLKEIGASMTYIAATWIAFSVPMLLAVFGGVLADRYNRFLLMFVGYSISAVAWVIYGVTENLPLFLAVNVIEGFAIAFSWPAKQAFFVQVVVRRWLGTLLGCGELVDATGGLARHAVGAHHLRLDRRLRHGRGRRRQPRGAGDRRADPLPRLRARAARGARRRCGHRHGRRLARRAPRRRVFMTEQPGCGRVERGIGHVRRNGDRIAAGVGARLALFSTGYTWRAPALKERKATPMEERKATPIH